MQAGQGIVEIARGAGGAAARSVVAHAAARSPLRLLTPKNHGGAAWVFASNLGGGIVDGDEIALRARVAAGAAALVTTQASTKVYRSPRGCRQRLEAEVGEGGTLVVLPDPVACFAGARFAQETTVRLSAGARLLLVDALTCGRAAMGERWDFDRYASTITVRRARDHEDELVVHDAIELDPRHGDVRARLGRFDALATIVGVGLGVRAPAPPRPGDDFVAVSSPLPSGEIGVLVRAAATSAERLHAGLRALLAELPALLGDDPFARKW